MTSQPTEIEMALCQRIGDALASETALEVRGGGTKAALGRPVTGTSCLDMSQFTGISLYEPDELVLSAGAATPLREIEAALSEHHQLLAFEPPDYGPLLDRDMAPQTIGGILACNLAGPRRIRAGSARDHFLGVRAVSGRGEFFKSGGRVVKNVTGYDMCKLLAGSYGTLAALTEVTIKVLPAPEKVRTVLVYGLSDEDAIIAMSEALRSPCDISAACHVPAGLAGRSAVSRIRDPGAAVTAVRIEGPEPSVAVRCNSLRGMLSGKGEIDELHRHNSERFWREIGGGAFYAGNNGSAVWRISVPPAAGAAVAAELSEELEIERFYDWGGGLVWLAVPPMADAGAATVRTAVARHGGHATLIRASVEIRASVPVFEPQPEALEALTARIKDGFDPRRILNPGRMYAER